MCSRPSYPKPPTTGDVPRLEYTLDTSHQATRGDVARETFTDAQGRPIDGSGTSIAVVDSGIDGTHPMFQWPESSGKEGSKVTRNLENVCLLGDFDGQFTDACLVDEPTNNTDTNSAGGHGTHVAGIAAGVDVTLPTAANCTAPPLARSWWASPPATRSCCSAPTWV